MPTLRTLLLVGLALLTATRSSQAQNAGGVPLLVSTNWLATHLDERDVVVIAVGMNRMEYDSAHVKGARFLAYSAYTRPENGLTSELPPLAVLDSVFESVGLTDASRVVIYGPPIVSHRLFLTLDVTGFRGRVGMLDGGLEAWAREERSTVSGPPTSARGQVTLKLVSDVLVDRKWVADHVDSSAYQFVDARMRARFESAHIPGAVSTPMPMFLLNTARRSTFASPSADSLRAALTASGVNPRRTVVAYCAIGETASVAYFVARLLGQPVKFYDGSMEDWTRSP